MEKYKISKMNSDLPYIQNRKQLRAISIQQIFDKVKKQSEQIDNHQDDIGFLKKITVQNLKYDYNSQSEKKEEKLRSSSLTHRLNRSKGSENNLIQQPYNQISINNRPIVFNNKLMDFKITKETLQLNQIEQHKKQINEVLNNFTKTKSLKSQEYYNIKKFSNLIASTNNLLSDCTSRQSCIKQQNIKQNEFEQQLIDGPLLSFRQYAKLQGYKLPTFLQ